LIGLVIGFCIVLVDKPPHLGGKTICNFYNPQVPFQTKQECQEDKDMVETYLKEELWRMYPKAVKIDAKGLCLDSK